MNCLLSILLPDTMHEIPLPKRSYVLANLRSWWIQMRMSSRIHRATMWNGWVVFVILSTVSGVTTAVTISISMAVATTITNYSQNHNPSQLQWHSPIPITAAILINHYHNLNPDLNYNHQSPINPAQLQRHLPIILTAAILINHMYNHNLNHHWATITRLQHQIFVLDSLHITKLLL